MMRMTERRGTWANGSIGVPARSANQTTIREMHGVSGIESDEMTHLMRDPSS